MNLPETAQAAAQWRHHAWWPAARTPMERQIAKTGGIRHCWDLTVRPRDCTSRDATERTTTAPAVPARAKPAVQHCLSSHYTHHNARLTLLQHTTKIQSHRMLWM